MKVYSVIVLGLAATAGTAIAGCGEDSASFEGDGSDRESASAEPAQPDDELYINHISSGGSGCSGMDSAALAFSTGPEGPYIDMKRMALSYPPGATVQSLGCSLNISMHVPDGLQVSVSELKAWGHADLPAGGKAQVAWSAILAGQPAVGIIREELVGPHHDAYKFVDQPPPEDAVWSACGGTVVLSLSASLSLDMNGNRTGSAAINAGADRGLKVAYKLQSRACPR